MWYSDLLVNSGDENGPCLEVGSVITVRSVSEVSCQFVFFLVAKATLELVDHGQSGNEIFLKENMRHNSDSST